MLHINSKSSAIKRRPHPYNVNTYFKQDQNRRRISFEFNKLSKITDRYYLSSDIVPFSNELITSTKITHIVNLCNVVYIIDDVKVKKIEIDDSPEVDIIHVILRVYEWLATEAPMDSDSRILIHCNYGISRSPSVLIGLLAIEQKFDSFQKIYDFVVSKRSCVYINSGFHKQLEANFIFLFNYSK